MSNFDENGEELDYEIEEEEPPRASTPLDDTETDEGEVTIEADVSGQLYRDNPDAVEREVRVLRLHNIKANRLGPIVPALAPEIFQPAAAHRVPTRPRRVYAPDAKEEVIEAPAIKKKEVEPPREAPAKKKKEVKPPREAPGPSRLNDGVDKDKKEANSSQPEKERKQMKATEAKPLSANQLKFAAKKKALWRLRRL